MAAGHHHLSRPDRALLLSLQAGIFDQARTLDRGKSSRLAGVKVTRPSRGIRVVQPRGGTRIFRHSEIPRLSGTT